MVYRGHIEKGMVVFDEPVALPDGVSVRVEISESEETKTLAEIFKDIIGAVELPADAAVNHDHYLYGKPKK